MPTDATYVPFIRVPVEEGTVEDRHAWEIICHSGANGPFLFGVCLWIWKRDGGDRFEPSSWDYADVLHDVNWMLSEGIRVGKEYFLSD